MARNQPRFVPGTRVGLASRAVSIGSGPVISVQLSVDRPV
jgi:hypothetical protein